MLFSSYLNQQWDLRVATLLILLGNKWMLGWTALLGQTHLKKYGNVVKVPLADLIPCILGQSAPCNDLKSTYVWKYVDSIQTRKPDHQPFTHRALIHLIHNKKPSCMDCYSGLKTSILALCLKLLLVDNQLIAHLITTALMCSVSLHSLSGVFLCSTRKLIVGY